jgi:hypothetical protein
MLKRRLVGGTFSAPSPADTDIKVLIRRSLDAVGRTEDTVLTAFTDGCSGLRRILDKAGVTEAGGCGMAKPRTLKSASIAFVR